jgi:shikimate 5-dehydrogenase
VRSFDQCDADRNVSDGRCIAVRALIPADVVFDMVYNPPITRLLRSARDQGKTVIQGTTMFLAQAARQFEIWTGHRAPSEIFEEKTELS